MKISSQNLHFNSRIPNHRTGKEPTLPTTIVRMPIAELKRDPENAREHSDRQIKQLAKSIRDFGFICPVIIDGSQAVLGGHARIKAAEHLGLKEVPTISIDHLSASQRRAFMIADNRLAEQASWNKEFLAKQLKELCCRNALDVSLLCGWVRRSYLHDWRPREECHAAGDPRRRRS
jgi:hypothetical protein